MKPSIALAELKQLLNELKNILIIDVRSKEEYIEMHIPLAASFPLEIIESGNFVPQPGNIIITVCGKGGGRSQKAANYLRENYNNEIYFLEGGTFGWFEK